MYASSNFATVGPTATQCGHWKSRNSIIVTGADIGPIEGESSMGTDVRGMSAADALKAVSTKAADTPKTLSRFMVQLYLTHARLSLSLVIREHIKKSHRKFKKKGPRGYKRYRDPNLVGRRNVTAAVFRKMAVHAEDRYIQTVDDNP